MLLTQSTEMYCKCSVSCFADQYSCSINFLHPFLAHRKDIQKQALAGADLGFLSRGGGGDFQNNFQKFPCLVFGLTKMIFYFLSSQISINTPILNKGGPFLFP